MANLNESTAKRIANFVRLMLSSEFVGEVIATIRALNVLLKNEGMTHHDIATVIENYNKCPYCNKVLSIEIEERKYSDTEMHISFNRGMEKGRGQYGGRALSVDYFDDNGEPRWLEMVNFCQNDSAFTSLKPNEQEFVDGLPAKLHWRAPSRPMGGFLLSIFRKLRGSLR